MWRNKIYKRSMIIIILLLLIVGSCNFPIFKISQETSDDYLKYAAENNAGKDVCILKYQYTTGAGWIVENSNNEKLINKSVILSSHFDPRLLKSNKEFELDYMAKYVVVANKITSIIYEKEKIINLHSDEITVLYSNANKNYYTIKDLRLEGIIKGIMGIFLKKYKLCY